MSLHLVDTTLFYSNTSGGVRRYLLEKHAWLACSHRWHHTLLVPGPADRIASPGIVEFRSPRLRAGYRCPVRCAAFRQTLAQLAPDLIEAADPYLVGWLAADVADALSVPAIAFCHSDVITLVRGRLGDTFGRAAARYLRALYERYQLVLAPSRVVATRLQEAGIGPVVVQPLGVDAKVFDPARRDSHLRERLNLAQGTRLLAFAGRLAPEKNLADLYAAIERLGDPYHLVVVGGEQRARISPHITLLPYEADPPRLAATLAGADALVHAGRQETFGLVALEAMACGLPVVAYDGGALAELVDADVGQIAARPTPSGLADAIAALYERDLATIGRAARARVLARHTWDAAFHGQLRIYEQVLDRHASRSRAVLQPA